MEFNDDEESYGGEFEQTYGEKQHSQVKTFCDKVKEEFRSAKAKPLIALCQEYKALGLDASDVAEGLQDNEYLPFLNIRYVVLAKIFKESGSKKIKEFVKKYDLDMADFIRYTIINDRFM